jgi:hypothetical protein
VLAAPTKYIAQFLAKVLQNAVFGITISHNLLAAKYLAANSSARVIHRLPQRETEPKQRGVLLV